MAQDTRIRTEYMRQYRLRKKADGSYDAMKEATRLRMQKWRANNPERARTKSREDMRRFRALRPKEFKKYYRVQQLRKYGLTIEEYEYILIKQNGRCAICKTDSPARGKTWALDHCHTTGKVRGILCQNCNLMLGNGKDSPSILRAAVIYLEASK